MFKLYLSLTNCLLYLFRKMSTYAILFRKILKAFPMPSPEVRVMLYYYTGQINCVSRAHIALL